MNVEFTDNLFKKVLPSLRASSDLDLSLAAGKLIEALRSKTLKMAAAESCSGGWIAKAVTDLAGCSDVFEGSLVTYSNQAKQTLLGVKASTLEGYGAVSQQVVEAMAAGAKSLLNVDCSVAVSGIAGPGGGTAEKPVGTVWIGWCLKGDQFSHLFQIDGNRETIRRLTCLYALTGLQRLVSTLA